MAAVFSGRRRHPLTSGTNRALAGIQTCAVIACASKIDMNLCGKLYPESTHTFNRFQFVNLEISGYFPKRDILVMPNSVTNMMMPLSPKEFSFTTNKFDKNAPKGIV